MAHESTEKWHMHIHVCTLTRLCAHIKHTNPVSQLAYTYMFLVCHLLQGGAEWQNTFPCVYAYTEVGDPVLLAKCHPMKQMYVCVAMWFT